jgi:uncharacterized membrane protein YfcA
VAKGKIHKAVGAASGTVVSLFYNYQKGNPDLFWIYVAGGFVGGLKGGGFADFIDEPNSPFHRSIGHSALFNGSIYFSKHVKKIFQDCLDWLAKRATEFINSGNRLLYYLCHFIAAFLIGFAAGHGTHLVTDMFTPMSLPIFW